MTGQPAMTRPASSGPWVYPIGVLLSVITVISYLEVFRNGFVDLDDGVYAYDNPYVASGLCSKSIRYAFTTFDLGNWIPVTWLSLQLDATLFGVRATWFHTTSLALHVANVLLIFAILNRMTFETQKSATVAVLFAVHPLHVESVAWVSERKDVLSMFWMLLAFFAYERYCQSLYRRWYWLTFGLLLLGLLSKPMLVTAPILLVLLDFWPLKRFHGSTDVSRYPRRPWKAIAIEKIPILLLSLSIGIVTIVAQSVGAHGGQSAMIGFDKLSVPIRIMNAANAYGWYLSKTFVPTHLMVMYPHPMDSVSRITALFWVVSLLMATLFVLTHSRRRPHLCFGWFWFLLSLLPVIGLLQVGSQAYADRYSYIPHIGLLVLVAWEVSDRILRLPQSRMVLAGLVMASVLIEATLTFRQVMYWRDPTTLWGHVLKIDPTNYFANHKLGVLNFRADRWDAAIEHFQRVIERQPYHAEALANLGYIYHRRSQLDLAEQYYLMAIRARPDYEMAINNLAQLDAELGRSNFAVPNRRADNVPEEAKMRYHAGLSLIGQRKMDLALKEFELALQIAPDYASAHNNAALTLVELGRPGDAIRHLEQAVKLDPQNANAQVNLSILLESEGRIAEATRLLEGALKIDPRDLESRLRLNRLKSKIH